MDPRRRGAPHRYLGFAPSNVKLATGDSAGMLRVVDAATGRVDVALRLTTAGVTCVAWSPRGRQIATASPRALHFRKESKCLLLSSHKAQYPMHDAELRAPIDRLAKLAEKVARPVDCSQARLLRKRRRPLCRT